MRIASAPTEIAPPPATGPLIAFLTRPMRHRILASMDLPLAPFSLSSADEAALAELYRRGTPENTLRAWERDLAYIAAWKLARFADDLTPVMAPARARQRIREHLGHGMAPLSVDPLERRPWWRGPFGIIAILLAAALAWYFWPR